MAASYLWAD